MTCIGKILLWTSWEKPVWMFWGGWSYTIHLSTLNFLPQKQPSTGNVTLYTNKILLVSAIACEPEKIRCKILLLNNKTGFNSLFLKILITHYKQVFLPFQLSFNKTFGFKTEQKQILLFKLLIHKKKVLENNQRKSFKLKTRTVFYRLKDWRAEHMVRNNICSWAFHKVYIT